MRQAVPLGAPAARQRGRALRRHSSSRAPPSNSRKYDRSRGLDCGTRRRHALKVARVEIAQPLEVPRPQGQVLDPNHSTLPRGQAGRQDTRITQVPRQRRPGYSAVLRRPCAAWETRVNAPIQSISSAALATSVEHILAPSECSPATPIVASTPRTSPDLASTLPPASRSRGRSRNCPQRSRPPRLPGTPSCRAAAAPRTPADTFRRAMPASWSTPAASRASSRSTRRHVRDRRGGLHLAGAARALEPHACARLSGARSPARRPPWAAGLSQNAILWGSARYGVSAESVLALEVVLADGSILRHRCRRKPPPHGRSSVTTVQTSPDCSSATPARSASRHAPRCG